MICITKPTAPSVLSKKGEPAAQTFCTVHDTDPDSYASGASTFDFDSAIYGHEDVKTALRAAQYDKCAFCDSDMMHTGYGDVEHFRPKGAWQQQDGGPLRYPGYFWLAYAWDNLFLSCQLCNQRYKRNLFPLRVQKHRACPTKRDVSAEDPLLIAPSADPDSHITFVGETAVPVRRSKKGRATIDILELNRDELVKRRRKLLGVLRSLRQTRDLLAELDSTPEVAAQLADLDNLLDEHTQDRSEYAAMARAFLA